MPPPEYTVLPEAQRDTSIRRASVRHLTCEAKTSLRADLVQTIAVQPTYYAQLYCVACNAEFPRAEFTWLSGDPVGGA